MRTVLKQLKQYIENPSSDDCGPESSGAFPVHSHTLFSIVFASLFLVFLKICG